MLFATIINAASRIRIHSTRKQHITTAVPPRLASRLGPSLQDVQWRPPIFQESNEENETEQGISICAEAGKLDWTQESTSIKKGEEIGTWRSFLQSEKVNANRDESLEPQMDQDKWDISASLDVLGLTENRVMEAGSDDEFAYWKEKIGNAMAANDSMALLQCTWEACVDSSIIEKITGATFTEMLRRIQPDDKYSPFHPYYKASGPKHYSIMKLTKEYYYDIVRRQREMTRDITRSRMRSGRQLGPNEYTQLMNLARANFDGTAAREIFRQMSKVGIEPSLSCYNYYCEALCWSDTYIPAERQALRFIPLYTETRLSSPKRINSLNQVIEGHMIQEGGVGWEVSRLLDKMIQNGVILDIRAYINLITALGREGNLVSLRAIIKKTWQVDVNATRAEEASRNTEELSLPKDSPTYPTQDLLFTLAHVFGLNNDLPTALRVVDQFRLKYGLPVTQVVWEELLSWTFVLTRKRNEWRSAGGASLGQLPAKAMESLWDTMRGELYDSQPTMAMYDCIIRHHWHYQHFTRMLKYMHEGRKIHEDRYQRVSKEDNLDTISPSSFYLQRTLASMISDEARVHMFTSHSYVCRWFRLLLSGPRWNIVAHHEGQAEARITEWQRRMLPDIVKEFWNYKGPRGIRYSIKTGHVSLDDASNSRLATPSASQAYTLSMDSLVPER